MMINWKEKLSSRKFWACIASAAGSVLGMFTIAESTIAKITCAILAFGSVCVYVFAETSIDKARIENPTPEQVIIETPVIDESPEICEGEEDGVEEG